MIALVNNLHDFVIANTICRFKGHDYGSVVRISPSMLHCCDRCHRDINNRTLNDLEPMTDDDWEWFETQQYLEDER